jgi:hypothetical protein
LDFNGSDAPNLEDTQMSRIQHGPFAQKKPAVGIYDIFRQGVSRLDGIDPDSAHRTTLSKD